MEGNVSKKKLSLKEFIWLGFNYTVGIGFVGNFAILSNIGKANSIGINAIWVFLIIGLVAGSCAWAFAKMAKIHNSDANGAAYIYVRTSFGRFWGWFVGFMQYVMLPFIITIQILMLIRGTFSPEFVKGNQWFTIHWGPFGDLFLDLIGIAIYLSAASVIFFGIKVYKRLAHGTGIIKWATAGLLIVAAFALAIQNGNTNWNYWTSKSELSFAGFMNTFTSCFFFFAGFEIFATAGKNIHNPEKNIGKGITSIILISTIFYIVISIIFFLAYAEFAQNMNVAAWDPFTSQVIKIGGPIIMIISGLALKINVAMQNALYGGTALQPLSKEGYISDKLFKLNNDGIPVKASLLNLAITSAMIILWLVIPDLIKGFWSLAHPNEEYASAFNISSLTTASSVLTIFIYMMVLIVVLKLNLTKKLKLNWYEKIIFPVVFLFLAVILVWHFYSLISETVDAILHQSEAEASAAIVGMAVEIAFILGSSIFAVCWYRWYYLPKYKKRLQENPDLQKELDRAFNFNQEHQDTLKTLEVINK
ncbi:MAG: APC family permease [Spiroplasma sp.]|nr:APC family permease [Spiroplasma sp.]